MYLPSTRAVARLWIANATLFCVWIGGSLGLQFIQGSVLEYSSVRSEKFDGTIMPIENVPDWTRAANTNKSLTYIDIPLSEFLPLPKYDETNLVSDAKDADTVRAKYEFMTVYMGSYRGNHVEYDGSHCGVDIRAPTGTPVLAVANGVVVRSVDNDTGNGKYIVIRHDGVPYKGQTVTLYSSYLHLSKADAVAGTAVKKGDVIGLVGMTGIATTPHLHFQIDRDIAPFHAYWPFSLSQVQQAGTDFFSAINIGLGKDDAIKYTVHPIEFVYSHLSGAAETPVDISSPTPSADTPIAVPDDVPTSPAVTKTSATLADSKTTDIIENGILSDDAALELVSGDSGTPTNVETATQTRPAAQDEPKDDTGTDAPPTDSTGMAAFTTNAEAGTPLYERVSSLYYRGIVAGDEKRFIDVESIATRRDSVVLLARVFGLSSGSTFTTENFSDVAKNDSLRPILENALSKGFVSPNKSFRPDGSITRAEFVKLLVTFSGMKIEAIDRHPFADIPKNDPLAPYVATFARFVGTGGGKFEPNKTLSRGDAFNLLYVYLSKKR